MPANFLAIDAADVESVVAMMAKLYASGNDPFDITRAGRATRELLAEPEFGSVWLIREGTETAGYLVLVLGYSLEFGGRCGLLDELFLEDSFRGRGLARDAIAFADSECRARGWQALRLEVGRTNQRAIDLYSRAGFQPHDRYLMTKWM